MDGNINIVGTNDYYFSHENLSAVPLLGRGFGYLKLGVDDSNNIGEQFGDLIIGGIELGKFRLAIEYNILPKTDLDFGESFKNSSLGRVLVFILVENGKMEIKFIPTH